jgi:hypothetical protein
VKSGKILVNCILTSVLAVSQNLIPVNQNQAKAQSVRPYAVFVNGWQNCCAWGMNTLQNRLIDQMNAEPRYVPYNNFDNNGKSGDTSTDERFLRDGADFINNTLDRNRPLILIGHSFGGDSILKLLPRINRRIQFVGVIDPVRTGGLRTTLKALTVPSNVDYFFNRWQTRVPFPNDFSVDGSISCNARLKCDQDSQNIKRFEDSSPHVRSCTATEKLTFQCPNSGKVQLRLNHQSISIDAYIQRQMGDRIQEQLAALPSNSSNVPGKYRLSDGTIFSSNGRDAYCTYLNMEHWSFAADKETLRPANSLPSFRNDGPCPVLLPAGNYRQPDGLIFYSNGRDAFCSYRRVPGESIRQLNGPVPYDRLMRNDGVCAGQ